jgi:hypothetical protein
VNFYVAKFYNVFFLAAVTQKQFSAHAQKWLSEKFRPRRFVSQDCECFQLLIPLLVLY